MDAVSESALEAIEAELTRKVIQEFQLTLDTLFYDTTNFFTYLASGNERSVLAQRGHSKQKRTDLRQFSLALLVARDGQIPLYADVYEGNVVDAQQFPDSLTAIRQRVEHIVGQLRISPSSTTRATTPKRIKRSSTLAPGTTWPPWCPSTTLTSWPFPRGVYPLGSGPLRRTASLSVSTHALGGRAHPGPVHQPQLRRARCGGSSNN